MGLVAIGESFYISDGSSRHGWTTSWLMHCSEWLSCQRTRASLAAMYETRVLSPMRRFFLGDV